MNKTTEESLESLESLTLPGATMNHVDEVESGSKMNEVLSSASAQCLNAVLNSGVLISPPLEAEGAATFSSNGITSNPSLCSSSESLKLAPSIHISSNDSDSTLKRWIHQFGWWWEVWATFLGLTSTILITAILFSMDGKPLRNWKTAVVQPNSLVSIFSTLAKTALLVVIAECLGQLKWIYFETPRRLNHFQTFDEASRGPWGATKLLFHTRGTTKLAALGAAAMIFMLAFEPFAQQVIQYVERGSMLESVNGTATVSYTWANINNQHLIGTDRLSLKNIYNPLVVSLTSALLEQPVDIAPAAYCPSAACDLASYDSLAVCSRCRFQRISNDYFDSCKYELREDHEYTNQSEFIEVLEKKRANKTSKDVATVACTKQISEQRDFGIWAYWNMSTTEVWLTALDSDMAVYGDAGWEPDTQMVNYTSNSFRFCMYEDWNDDPAKYQDDPRVGAQGARHRRRAFFATDPQSKTMIASAYCLDLQINPWLWLNAGRFGEVNGTVTNCRLDFCAQRYINLEIRNGEKKMESVDHFPLTILESAENSSTYHFINPNIPRIYTVGNTSRNSLVYMFHSIAQRNDKDRYQYDFMIRPQNWPIFYDGLAAALTNFIQSPHNPHAENISTVAYGLETYVTVRWRWMTLPLVLVFMSIWFLCMTVLKSRKKGYLLKTSILPVLYYGGAEWGSLLQGVGRTAGDLERSAEGERAVFKENS